MEKLICPECGATMTMRTENRLYDADVRVTLADLRVKHCDECGHTAEIIPKPRPLQRSIIRAIAEQPGRLLPADIRFIRDYLGLTGVEFAKTLGINPVTLSRWETAAAEPSAIADRAVRVLAAGAVAVDKLQAIGDEPRTGRLLLRYDGTQWKVTGPTRSERLVSGGEA